MHSPQILHPTHNLLFFHILQHFAMKQKLITLLFLPALLLFFKNDPVLFTGKITDASNDEELIGVVLMLTSKDTTITLITDMNGDFRAFIPEGQYQVKVNYAGYLPYEIAALDVRSPGLTHNIKMASPILILDEARICKINLIKADQTAPITEQNAPALISPDAGDIAIKGSRSDATQYYNDGVRVFATPPPAEQEKTRKEVKANHQAPAYKAKTAKEPQKAPSRSTAAKPMSAPASKPPAAPKRVTGQIMRDSIVPETTDVEQYNTIKENAFQETSKEAFSTFSIDVDAASYSNIRRYLNSGAKPPQDAVRIEEMINYFDYQYPTPEHQDPVRIITELGACPWNPEHQLLMVGLQGRTLQQQQLPPSNLVFLVDVSGSMNSTDKLPLVKESLYLLLDELRPTDRVALVTYAGNTAVVLPSTPASDKSMIKNAIASLGAGGGTAGASGIQLAYQTARANLMQQGNNRVILCTDGDFNLGISSEEELVKLIEEERKSGVYLTVLGYGTGNYQDGKMQELADHGNGNHAYIDQISEAKKVLVKEFAGTLITIAKDVKFQLEFNPDKVASYRLIGYENRMLAKEDFNNDAKDAGELGAGHTVTALYEIIPAANAAKKSGDIVKLKFRYKPPTGTQKSRLIEQRVSEQFSSQTPSENFRFAAAVAEAGLLLRNSAYKSAATWEQVIKNASEATTTDANGYKLEFVELAKKAAR